MSLNLLEQGVAALGPLSDEVVFVGAATLVLWITDPAAPPLRPTADVDVVVEVTTLIEYNEFEVRLRRRGFRDEGHVLGRFLFGPADLQLDAIPADATILGFENRWQQASLPAAVVRGLPSGATLRALPPPQLLATKLEAFAARGSGDFLASPDFEDVVALVDGRPELVEEVLAAPGDLRRYIVSKLAGYAGDARAREAIVAHLEFGREGRARADAVVFPALDRLVHSVQGS